MSCLRRLAALRAALVAGEESGAAEEFHFDAFIASKARMSHYRLTPAAQRDLSSIWDHTQERWDARQVETYVLEIRGAIERIGSGRTGVARATRFVPDTAATRSAAT